MILVALLACSGTDDTGADLGPSTALTDANNYTFDSTLAIPSFTTHEGADVEVCWDQVVHDMQCHDFAPTADVRNVGLMRAGSLTQAEVEEALAADALQQASITGYVQYTPQNGETCASLSEFSLFGTDFSVAAEYTAAGGTYMVILSDSDIPGQGARSLAFLSPDAGDRTANVSLGDGCGIVSVDAQLTAVEPIRLPSAPGTVSWPALTRDGQGLPLDASRVDSVMIAFYEGRTPADLEATLLDLEIDATRMYFLTLLGGTEADLALATGDDGAFTGFSGDGTWLLALRCGSCYNPAPLFLGVVEPQ
jgi:hypothetical protein